MKFENLNLIEPILRSMIKEGYTVPTPIQQKAIPIILERRDLVGCAQTGTGKTAAFAIPLLQLLYEDKIKSNANSKVDENSACENTLDNARASKVQGDNLSNGINNNKNSTVSKFSNQSNNMTNNKGNTLNAQASRNSQTNNHSFRSNIASETRKIKALIITPTRELAIQIDESFAAYGRFTGIRHTVIFGGVSQNPQAHAIRSGVDILVATPGRLLDLIGQRIISLENIEFFVLDEADRMLDMGFAHDMKKIIALLPRKRQTLLFSATMPQEIEKLVNSILINPLKVEVTPTATTVDSIEQSVYFVDQKEKKYLLIKLLKGSEVESALVFTRTKHGADKVVKDLEKVGIPAQAIHGNKSQTARQLALKNFKSKITKVLVATDIAARGIDVRELSHVFNFDIPNIPETYVHRIGRTGRAGLGGTAVSFCDREEKEYLRDIQKLISKKIPVIDQTEQVC